MEISGVQRTCVEDLRTRSASLTIHVPAAGSTAAQSPRSHPHSLSSLSYSKIYQIKPPAWCGERKPAQPKYQGFVLSRRRRIFQTPLETTFQPLNPRAIVSFIKRSHGGPLGNDPALPARMIRVRQPNEPSTSARGIFYRYAGEAYFLVFLSPPRGIICRVEDSKTG